MSWVGRIAVFVLLQLVFVVFLLAALGRLPQHELSLLWRAVVTGQSAADAKAAEPKVAPKPEETPSYEELLQARTLEALELDRKRKEQESLAKMVEARQAKLDASLAALKQLKLELDQSLDAKDEAVAREGRQKVLTLLETVQPKIAKNFLVDVKDDAFAIDVIKQLDPVAAAKVFKEFKQPDEQRKLNSWLAKLGQGEPEASRTKQLRERLPAR